MPPYFALSPALQPRAPLQLMGGDPGSHGCSSLPEHSGLTEGGKPFSSALTTCRNRAAYQEPPEQMIELSREQQEEGEDGYRDEDPSDPDQESPDQAGQ